MPPKGARRANNAGATRGRGRAKLNRAGALAPALTDQWSHLSKKGHVQEPLDPQPGYGCLSLSIPSLASRTAEKGWELLSSRASLYSPQRSADEAAQLVERDRLQAERQQEILRQEKERELLISRSVGFLSLKLSGSALERSQLPFAQSWIANRAINTVPDFDHSQTEDPKSLNHCIKTSSPSKVAPNELENELQRLRPRALTASTITEDDPGLTDSLTLQALEFSPLTPTYPVVEQFPSPSATADLTNDRGEPYSDIEYQYSNDLYGMAGDLPMNIGGIDESIKDVIQNLFVMQQHVASFKPDIQDGLNKKVEDLAVSLKQLDDLVVMPSNPIHEIKIAPDIIDYVDDGRNPDIYTRDFVELVQRGNAVLNGKQRAFRNFSKIYAESLKKYFDGMDEEVDMIMENAGVEEKDEKYTETQQNGGTS